MPDAFQPPIPAQVTFMFYFLALIISVCDLFCHVLYLKLNVERQVLLAVLSVYGRLWISTVISHPIGAKTFKDRARRFMRRKEVADKLLVPLLSSFQPILIFSITLFATGALYQALAWDLVVSQERHVPILVFTGSTSTFLSFMAILVVGWAAFLAIRAADSPFGEPISTILSRLVRRLGSKLQRAWGWG